MPKHNVPKPKTQSVLALIPLPNGGKIRTTPSGRISVFDFIREATQIKNPRSTWQTITTTYPEVVAFADNYDFGNRGPKGTPVVGKEGYLRLLHFLGGKVGQAYRDACDAVVIRYFSGDPTLAAEVLDRNPNPEEALLWLNQRQETKRTNRALNQVIKEHHGSCYVDVAILTCKAATGKAPAALCKLREGGKRREIP